MKKTEWAPHMMRRKHPKWVHLILVAMIGVVVGIGQGVAAPGDPNKPAISKPEKKPDKPIKTKSGKKAALKDAAADLLRAPAGPMD